MVAGWKYRVDKGERWRDVGWRVRDRGKRQARGKEARRTAMVGRGGKREGRWRVREEWRDVRRGNGPMNIM